MYKSRMVKKSNQLIEARYKLSFDEQRVILYLVSMIQPNDEDFKIYTINIKDFMELAEIQNKGMYRQFENIGKSLISKTLTIKKDESTLILSWLSSAEYLDNRGKIELCFDPKLKPYLLQLKNNFTMYKLENVIKLRSFYSIRIYELLKQYEKFKERVFTLEQLREYLGIADDKYALYTNFKQRVLNTSQKELKEKSDIYFEIEEIKMIRKVTKIKFIIYKNSTENRKKNIFESSAIESEDCKDKIIDEVRLFIKEPLTKKEIYSILEVAKWDIDLIKRCYEFAKNKRELTNLAGFLVWACGHPNEIFTQIKSERKNGFNNFEGRKWDYEELERMESKYLDSLITRRKDRI